MVMVELIKDEAHVGATGLCCAAAAACEGVCSVVHGGEAVALCAGHCSEGEGVAVSVHGCEHRVVCSVCGMDAAGVPQGTEDPFGTFALVMTLRSTRCPSCLALGRWHAKREREKSVELGGF